MKEDINKTIHLKCQCDNHVIQVNTNLKFKGNEQYFQEWNFSIFKLESINKPSLLHRIKVAITYLRKGTMHKDQVILSEADAEKLSLFIDKNNYSLCATNYS